MNENQGIDFRQKGIERVQIKILDDDKHIEYVGQKNSRLNTNPEEQVQFEVERMILDE